MKIPNIDIQTIFLLLIFMIIGAFLIITFFRLCFLGYERRRKKWLIKQSRSIKGVTPPVGASGHIGLTGSSYSRK